MISSSRPLRVFLCHSSDDKPTVRELYHRLETEGWIDAWLDEEKLYPGQDWNYEIELAVEAADVIITCLTKNSVTKEGYVQHELRIVLDLADYKPEGTLFVIPVRLEECEPPRRLRRWQYANYFPEDERERAYERLVSSLRNRAHALGLTLEKASSKDETTQPIIQKTKSISNGDYFGDSGEEYKQLRWDTSSLSQPREKLVLSGSDRDSQSPEELRRQFSDREKYIQIFETLLIKSLPVPVLVFHGLGGTGKTYLMRYLMYEYGCRWKDPTQGYPHAFLSFRSGQTPTSIERALWQAREQLIRANSRIMFPRFDIVWGKLWERSYQMSIKENRELNPEEVGWISELLEASEIIPIIDDAAKEINLLQRLVKRLREPIVLQHILEWFQERVQAPKALGWKIALQSMDLQELTELLPAAFAADLTESATYLLSPYNRVIMFIDNYETLQEQLGESFGKETINFVQVLSKEFVQLKSNILMVIAGRDRLRWGEVRRRDGSWVLDPVSIWAQEISPQYSQDYLGRFLRQYLIGDLSEADAKQYLVERHQLIDQALVSQIYEFTGGYPLALGVAADLIAEVGVHSTVEFDALRARVSGCEPLSKQWREEVNDWLLERLIEQLKLNGRETLITLTKAAAVPQWFNEELLFSLVGDLSISEHFRQLTRYSFVERYEVEGIHAYRLHTIMRRLIAQSINLPIVREKWEESAAKWFEARVNEAEGRSRWRYRFASLYHLWHLRPMEAAHRLQIWFEELELSDQGDLCWELLNTSSEGEQILPLDLQVRLNLYRCRLQKRVWQSQGGNRELALQYGEEAVTLAEKVGDKHLMAEAYIATAWALIYAAVGVSDEPKRYFSRALEMFQRTSTVAESISDFPKLAQALRLRACTEIGHNPDYGNFSFIDRAITLYEQSGDQIGQLDGYTARAVLGIRFEQWKIVQGSLLNAEKLYRNMSEPPRLWRATLFQLWGEYKAQLGLWQAATDYLEKARRIYEELTFISGMCASIGWLGLIQCYLGNEEKGLVLLRDSLQTERDTLGSQEGVSKWLHYFGKWCISRNEFERALHAFWLSESLREVLGHGELGKTRRRIREIREKMDPARFKQIEAEFQPRKSEFGEYAFLWGVDYFRKYEGNPILRPQGRGWESQAVYNPAAWTDGEKTYLLYRACESCDSLDEGTLSRIGLAISDDGIHFKRESLPVLQPTEAYELPGGCEDPRLVRIDDFFYMTYTAYNGKTARLSMARSRDLRKWEKLGPLFTDEQWEQCIPYEEFRGPNLQCRSKAGAILNRPINGYYWMYFGDTHIWAAYSKDLSNWEISEEPVLSPRSDRFDSWLVEAGPPPILWPDEGIWLGYNGADSNFRYAFGQALFAADNPTKLIRRCTHPLLIPSTPEEISGQVPQVVFGEGIVLLKGKWFLYYGMADSRIGVAIADAHGAAIHYMG